MGWINHYLGIGVGRGDFRRVIHRRVLLFLLSDRVERSTSLVLLLVLLLHSNISTMEIDQIAPNELFIIINF